MQGASKVVEMVLIGLMDRYKRVQRFLAAKSHGSTDGQLSFCRYIILEALVTLYILHLEFEKLTNQRVPQNMPCLCAGGNTQMWLVGRGERVHFTIIK